MAAGEIDEPAIAEMPEAAARPTRVRYVVLATACLLAVITYLLRVGFSVASEEFKGELGLNARHLGYLWAAFMIAYGLFEVPWGVAGDRLGVRNVLAAIVLGAALTTGCVALVAFVPGGLVGQLGFLLVLRFLFGMLQAGTFPALSRMMADWMPIAERGRAQGFIWMSTRMGGAVVPLLLGALFRRVGDWRPPLVLLAGLGVAWCAGFWPWFRDRPEEMGRVNAEERARIAAGRSPRAGSGHGRVPWGLMLRSRSAWALCFMYAGIGFSGNFFLSLLPNYLRSHRHLGDAAFWIQALPFAFGAIACVVGGAASDALGRRWGSRRWGRTLVGAAGLALASASILAVPWAGPTWLLALLLVLTFVGNDLAMGPSWAAAADLGERFAGTLGGAMNMVSAVAATAAAFVTGDLLDRHQDVLLFSIFACSYGIGALLWFAVDVRKVIGGP